MSKMVALLANNTTFLFAMLKTDYLDFSLPSPQSDHVYIFFIFQVKISFCITVATRNKTKT